MATEGRPETGQQVTKDLEPVLNWTQLSRNDDLELVHRNGKVLATGNVDMLAHDGSVFWLIQHGGKGRAMFLPQEDVIVYRHRRRPGRPSGS